MNTVEWGSQMVHEQLLCSALPKGGASQPLSCVNITLGEFQMYNA